jgi:DNA-binding IclR family transcriptional regulator
MANTERTNRVKTTVKSFRLIQSLKELDGGRVTELADELSMGKSTVHNHLQTLADEGYVIQRDDEYHLSLQFLELGGYIRNQMDIYGVAEPEVKALAEETGELANFAVAERGKLVYIYRSKGHQAVDLDTYAGMRAHMHNTALGKAILSNYPEERVESILDRHGMPAETEYSITDRERLFEELDQIRSDGFAQDYEERLEGLRCVAAPITSAENVVRGAISVSTPKSRMKDERFNDEVPEKVRSAANVIELNLKYS